MVNIAAIVVNLSRQMDKEIFHYCIPEKLVHQIKIGCRVQVPIGQQICEGFVIDFPQTSEVNKLKEIIEVIDREPIISQEMVNVAIWVSRSYLCSLHKVLEYIIPPSARLKKEKIATLTPQSDDLLRTVALLDDLANKVLEELKKGPKLYKYFLKKYGREIEKILDDLIDRGLIEVSYDFSTLGNSKYITMVKSNISKEDLSEIIEKYLPNAPKQQQIIKYLIEYGPEKISLICQKLDSSNNTIASLEKKGLITKFKTKEERMPQVLQDFNKSGLISLNSYQKEAVNKITQQIEDNKYRTFLIHGVTGSGKTEVYLQCIKYALQKGKGAIVLVPEISLTPQVIGRFKSVLGEQVKVLHSGLSTGERLDVWESLRTGAAKVVVGVRSAVFAPVQNLGIIIIDEEHESTFKQSEPDPRYHARDVALHRAENSNSVLVLGSATPAVESYYKAQKQIYELIEMPYRVKSRPLPTIKIVDLRRELQIGNRSIFSKELKLSIEETIAKEEQVILFLNRRGYSTFVLCRECGQALQCKNCEISLTYHTTPLQMKCHYCEYTTSVPKRCPNCGSSFIRYFGSGTQLVEEEIKKLWPHMKVTRMDVDTTGTKNAHQKLLSQFSRRESHILLGTQMITKGLDFPNVTLVGVIAADTSLNIPDYTASEKTFQLITQVAGRAGRGEKSGKVIIQTYNPDHYAVLAGQNHNYQQFYQQEIEARKIMEYPPFSSLVRILISDTKENLAQSCAEDLADIIGDKYQGVLEILGPAPAPITKIKNRFRWQVILKGSDLELLRQGAKFGYNQLSKGKTNKNLRVIIDVEPQNIL